MFLIVTTQPLNDGTKGFRFNAFGVKGMLRKQRNQSIVWFLKDTALLLLATGAIYSLDINLWGLFGSA